MSRRVVHAVIATALIGAAPVAAAPAVPNGVVAYSFEDGSAGWTGTEARVKVQQDTRVKRSGKASLKLTGTAGAASWSLAASPMFSLKPGKKYTISAWMLVESWSAPRFAPMVKCGVYTDTKWSSNAFSAKYDLKKMKQWQQVTATFVAPRSGAINGAFGLEKGTQEPITATVYLDDVKLEPAK